MPSHLQVPPLNPKIFSHQRPLSSSRSNSSNLLEVPESAEVKEILRHSSEVMQFLRVPNELTATQLMSACKVKWPPKYIKT